MLGFAALIFGIVVSFILSSVARNQREGRDHSITLVSAGYLVAGMLIAAAVALPLLAILNPNSMAEVEGM